MPAVRQSRAMAAPSTPTMPIHASISCGHSPTRAQACARLRNSGPRRRTAWRLSMVKARA
ncbi:hypothetical protein [Streptomyces sp. NPDC003720]|uniref:hypothetical protein n=1 Tax=Streptomyces sp. NPDC003720 TaxID=3364684 RepID=UPI00368000DD